MIPELELDKGFEDPLMKMVERTLNRAQSGISLELNSNSTETRPKDSKTAEKKLDTQISAA